MSFLQIPNHFFYHFTINLAHVSPTPLDYAQNVAWPIDTPLLHIPEIPSEHLRQCVVLSDALHFANWQSNTNERTYHKPGGIDELVLHKFHYLKQFHKNQWPYQ